MRERGDTALARKISGRFRRMFRALKMIPRNMRYYFKEAWRNFWRSQLMTLATVTTISVSLIVLGAVYLIALNLDILSASLESQIEITVYLKDGLSDEHTNRLFQTLQGWKEIKDVEYVSKEKALFRMKEELGEQRTLLEDLGENPLPASLEIELVDSRQAKIMKTRLEEMVGVEDVVYGEEWIEQLLNITSLIRMGGGVAVGLLFVTSLLIIYNAIRVSVFARRQEIDIMQLVGASSWFVRWPFLIEGLMQGLVGSLIAGSILYFSYIYVSNRIIGVLPFLPIMNDKRELLLLIIAILVLGSLLGLIGSFFSSNKFLKEQW